MNQHSHVLVLCSSENVDKWLGFNLRFYWKAMINGVGIADVGKNGPAIWSSVRRDGSECRRELKLAYS